METIIENYISIMGRKVPIKLQEITKVSGDLEKSIAVFSYLEAEVREFQEMGKMYNNHVITVEPAEIKLIVSNDESNRLILKRIENGEQDER